MRNLKRALSLALASVMLMGMMVVGTGAAFTDADSITNTEAAEVLNAIGLLKGDTEGAFNPDQVVTRAEVATIMARVYTGDADYTGAEYVGIPSFTDIEGHWAEGAINYAYNEGLADGYTDGSFKPDAPVTTAEFYIFMGRLLGYYENGEGTGNKWALDAVKYAKDAGINEDTLKATAPLTRDDVATIVFSTIVAEKVKFITDEESADYKTYDGQNTVFATDLGLNESTASKDTMGRPTTNWTLKGETDVVATSTAAADAIFTASTTYGDVGDKYTKDPSDSGIVLNGDATAVKADVFGKNDGDFSDNYSIDGIVIEVFEGYKADGSKDASETLYVAYTYETSAVDSVEYDEDEDQTTITLDSGASLVVDGEDDTYAVDDVVTYTANGTAIDTIEMSNIVIGTVDGYKGTTVTVDGVAYTITADTVDVNDIAEEATIVLDPNGYAISFSTDAEDADVAYLYTLIASTGSDLDGFRVKVVFANGSTEVIYVDTLADSASDEDPDDIAAGTVTANTIYTYSEDDGVYSLTKVTADTDAATVPSADDFNFDSNTMNGDTVFVDVDAGVIYTGFQNVPTFVKSGTDAISIKYVVDTDIVVMFIENAEPDDATDDETVYAYVEDADSSVSKDANGDAVYTYTVFVNGKETTIVADATSIATGWVTFSEFDENGTATKYAASVVFDAADLTITYQSGDNFWAEIEGTSTKFTVDSDTVYVIVEDGEISTTVASKVVKDLAGVSVIADEDNLVSLFVITK